MHLSSLLFTWGYLIYMGRRGPFRNQRVAEQTCLDLEQIMEAIGRQHGLNAFVEELLALKVAELKKELKIENKPPVFTTPKKVHRIGPGKGVDERDERNRKAS